MRVPAERRKDDDVRTLRKALGFTLSVAIVAVPDMGLSLLSRLASYTDTDIRWIIRTRFSAGIRSNSPSEVQ